MGAVSFRIEVTPHATHVPTLEDPITLAVFVHLMTSLSTCRGGHLRASYLIPIPQSNKRPSGDVLQGVSSSEYVLCTITTYPAVPEIHSEENDNDYSLKQALAYIGVGTR